MVTGLLIKEKKMGPEDEGSGENRSLLQYMNIFENIVIYLTKHFLYMIIVSKVILKRALSGVENGLYCKNR